MQPATRRHLRANLLMLIAAIIWGSAFVAQRLSLDAIGPFLFTGLRFLLGAGVVFALIACLRPTASRVRLLSAPRAMQRDLLVAGVVLGILLALSISLQQIGLKYTKIANAGFITSLYVIIVPVLGVLMRHQTGMGTWLGALLAVVGMYFLSVSEHFTILYGDWFQLGCAVVISVQVMVVGYFARRLDPLALSLVQFVVCGVICLAIALAIEPVNLAVIAAGAPTVLYGGALSVGIGYTIQVVAQKDAAPAHAAVIFSMEGVFAALSGWIVLGETLSSRALFGCALMLTGLIVCQLLPLLESRRAGAATRA
ncbi:DMT family transporter [Paraburkholderia phosphatilytica]|uniref:DMT family transporter n=1 Tax=Paraburkholderia phosphatilytica TaxID=2282883 RepID=UPI000E4E71F2|nr:DMT family transporter [Paraburkholderia phosphatilytica]